MREMEYPVYPPVSGPRLRWTAVFAGSAMTLAAIAAFTVLGLGLRPMQASDPELAAVVLPGPGGAWWPLVSGIAAFYMGGWFASRLSDSGRRSDGVIYGLVCWAASTVFSASVQIPALGGAFTAPVSGAFAFSIIAAEAAVAAVGGLTGARFYLPVPITEYRRTHRGLAGARG